MYDCFERVLRLHSCEKPRSAGVLKGPGFSRAATRLEVLPARLEAAPLQNLNANFFRGRAGTSIEKNL
jgi:hypothetical protein